MSPVEKARSRAKRDRFGLVHMKPGCGADELGLGWVPGVRYTTNFGADFLVLGYCVSGQVEVRFDDGETRRHMTSSQHARVLS